MLLWLKGRSNPNLNASLKGLVETYSSNIERVTKGFPPETVAELRT